MRRISGFKAQNVIACFNETAGGGEVLDYNAPRNAPVKNPIASIANVTWHSDFDQFEIVGAERTVTVAHPSVPGKITYLGLSYNGGFVYAPSNIQVAIYGQSVARNTVLFTHNLGYVPKAFVAIDGNIIPTGYAVQIASNGTMRIVSVYADATVIGLREIGYSLNVALPAISKTYKLLVFRKPVADPTLALMDFNAATNVLRLAKGKIRSDRKYLRRVGVGDSPYDINRGRTIDIKNGRTKVVTGGTAIIEPGYNGSFAGPSSIAVGV